MTNWTINAINTINHNDVEYIYVPFNHALFRDKSNQTHKQFKKIITRQGETKPCFLFEVEKHSRMFVHWGPRGMRPLPRLYKRQHQATDRMSRRQ